MFLNLRSPNILSLNRMMWIGRKYSGVVCSVNQGARAGRRSARRRSQHHRCRGPEEREAEAAGEREAGAWRSRRAGCWREVWWGHGMGYKSRWTCIFASRCPLNTRRDRRRDRYKSCWMSFFCLFFSYLANLLKIQELLEMLLGV